MLLADNADRNRITASFGRYRLGWWRNSSRSGTASAGLVGEDLFDRGRLKCRVAGPVKARVLLLVNNADRDRIMASFDYYR
ncbi:hypothetical protein [Actinokineospora inagensis]|uniref:hypothetical protein n=1 Tax=Actinokineospora inagensis TaxID=103730 RepID=UPI0003FE72C0|nr:hypothetical protein [Actinokineospora inagensis]